jgi:thiamine kinase-like enzyme
MEAALNIDPPPDVPTHGDLLPGNILSTPSGVRLIDYDYAGMAEPAWDLGVLVSENSLSPAQVELISRRYWGRKMQRRDVARVRLYAIVVHIAYGQLVWSLRGALPDLLPGDVWGLACD